jgi:nucleotide-binding universal stress UspA family protein
MNASAPGNGRRSDSAPALFANRGVVAPPEAQALTRDRCHRVLACVGGDTATAASILRQARAVALGLDLTVTVGRVIETRRNLDAPADPLEWQIRQGEFERELEQLATADAKSPVESVLLTGDPAVELREWAQGNGAILIAIATHEGTHHEGSGLGSIAKKIFDEAGASLLLVPPGETTAEIVSYSRLLVPLDGSLRAESVIPIAVRIARTHGAELLLAYVVPRLDLVEASFVEARGRALCAKLEDHNENRARKYLEELRVRLWRDQVPTRSIVITQAEPRASLRRLAMEQHIDLIILSSQGCTGMTDVPCGSVTEYLATHAPVPMLIVRPNFAHTFSNAAVSPDDTIARPVVDPAG